MKIRIVLIALFAVLLNSSQGQVIQCTIKPGAAANEVAVLMKPNFNNTASDYLYQIQIPIAWQYGIAPVPTGLQVTLDPTFIATFGNNYAVSVYTLANSNSLVDKYYVISLVRSGVGASVNQTWTSGTEYAVLTAKFTSALPAASGQVKVSDYLDGGSNGQGNFYTLGAVSGTYFVDPSDSRGNFYATPALSAVGGTASDGFVQTLGSILLPVDLTFSGYRDGSRNQLRWTTSVEVNNKGFDVQRSLDGVNYTSIGFVNTLAANGNSAGALNYTFTDNNVSGSKQFYRLRQVDYDGNSKLSNIVLLKSDKPSLITIDGMFPNPATTVVNLMLSSPVKDKLQMVVLDVNGRIVKVQSINVESGSNTLPVNVASLAGGTYMVKIISSNGEVTTGKLVKQ